ncbi:MAG TPA: carboxylesterase, partial [Savagea sp.]
MIHHFFKGQAHRPVYLLLHGTGGTEHDLIPLAKQLDAQASILTVRGEVQENGMSRFFKRIAEGVFDLEDLKLRTERLYVFIQEAAKQYQFSVEDVVLVGYSNGANIAANL